LYCGLSVILYSWCKAELVFKYTVPAVMKSVTCQLFGANSFDYLTELQRQAQELAANPAEWMPWIYRETLAKLTLC